MWSSLILPLCGDGGVVLVPSDVATVGSDDEWPTKELIDDDAIVALSRSTPWRPPPPPPPPPPPDPFYATPLRTRGAAVFCDCCEQWLNGSAQWDDHKQRKKHRKNWRVVREQLYRDQQIHIKLALFLVKKYDGYV